MISKYEIDILSFNTCQVLLIVIFGLLAVFLILLSGISISLGLFGPGCATLEIGDPPNYENYETPTKGSTLDIHRVDGKDIVQSLRVMPGEFIRIQAEGIIDFGSGWVVDIGAPKLGPDGDCEDTPSDYPYPNHWKNSLIVRIGDSVYQGGTDVFIKPEISNQK